MVFLGKVVWIDPKNLFRFNTLINKQEFRQYQLFDKDVDVTNILDNPHGFLQPGQDIRSCSTTVQISRHV